MLIIFLKIKNIIYAIYGDLKRYIYYNGMNFTTRNDIFDLF